MPNHDEQERLKRLRERQLAARDPHKQQKKREQIYVQREKRIASKKTTFREMWQDIPHTIKGPLYGLVAGLVIFILLPIFWSSTWTLTVSLGSTVLLIVIGSLIGRAVQTREDLKELTRR
jgi:tetrahydromethanopterin S-methyltransferase subunit G